MKILLIGSYCGKDIYRDTEAEMRTKKQFVAPSLGLHRIASWLRPRYDVVIYNPDVEDDPYEYLEAVANEFSIIGFSLTHDTLEHDLSLMWKAKEVNPKAVLVVGGEEATFNHELIRKYSPVNIIVFGEGEYPMSFICGLVDAGDTNLGNIDGWASPLKHEGFREATLRMDSATIPYEGYWDILEHTNDNHIETRTIRIFTSNYCPWGCSFCSSTNFLSTAYLKRPKFACVDADDLLCMIRNAVEHHPKVRTIYFQDDNFIGLAGQDRIYKLCKGIQDNKVKERIPEELTFMCQTRVNDVSETILLLMAEVGFRLVSYGVESFSQRMLDEFKKRVIVEQIDKALEWTYKAKMKLHINVILTSPECKISDIRTTVRKCKEHLERGAELGINLYPIPLPGSRLAKDAKDLIEYRKVNISGTALSFDKAEKVIPEDKKVRELLRRTNQYLDAMDFRKIKHFNSNSKSRLDLEAVEYALKEV